jgi:hypothetical protein
MISVAIIFVYIIFLYINIYLYVWIILLNKKNFFVYIVSFISTRKTETSNALTKLTKV